MQQAVLLHHIEGPINLGSVCRAMANTGFKHLRFTGPLQTDHPEARKFAVHARDLLDAAEHRTDFDDLIHDVDCVFGFSPRSPLPDGSDLSLDHFHEHCDDLLQRGRRIGFLFGNEAHGLANEHLARCRFRVALPTDETYPSMNLAQAVTVVLWERRRRGLQLEPMQDEAWVGAEEKAQLLQNLRTFLNTMDFLDPQNPDHLWREIEPIFQRRDWRPRELNLLHAIFGKARSRYQALRRRSEDQEMG